LKSVLCIYTTTFVVKIAIVVFSLILKIEKRNEFILAKVVQNVKLLACYLPIVQWIYDAFVVDQSHRQKVGCRGDQRRKPKYFKNQEKTRFLWSFDVHIENHREKR